MAMTHYAVQIDSLLEKMFAIKPLVLPANRRFVEKYLDSVWSYVTELTAGFRRAEWSEALRERFQGYVEAEEEKMRDQLEIMRYDIDAADTLLLITGPGRIEKVRTPRVPHNRGDTLMLCTKASLPVAISPAQA